MECIPSRRAGMHFPHDRNARRKKNVAIEIERRFLVRDTGAAIRASAGPPAIITQGYFGCIDGLRVRVRIMSDGHDDCRAFLTFKGVRRGLCRAEFEYPLELERAQRALRALPPARIIRKLRHQVPCREGISWSVDEFGGENVGLVIAEVELCHPQQEIELPHWIGKEVTFDRRYGNSRLAYAPIRRLLADVA